MSAVATPTSPLASRPVKGNGVTQWNVVRSEWTKLWTLRSTRWTLLAAFIAMTAFGIAVAGATMWRWAQLDAHDLSSYDSRNIGVSGFQVAQLGIGVLGILVITGEYATGMIKSSFMAVPKRLPVFWAKLAVFCSVTFVAMLVATAISFFGVQAISAQHSVQHAIGDPGSLRVLLGTPLMLTVLAAMSVSIGALVRNTAGGIALWVFLLFVLPGLTGILPHATQDKINPYLPLDAASTVATSTFDFGAHLAPWTGFAVFCGYTAVAIAAAAVGLVRRDA